MHSRLSVFPLSSALSTQDFARQKSAPQELISLVPERQEPNIARSSLLQVAGFVEVLRYY
ncbi:hypothetical protein J3F84DRAFT_371147 [Trichoderma pleuroticola]